MQYSLYTVKWIEVSKNTCLYSIFNYRTFIFNVFFYLSAAGVGMMAMASLKARKRKRERKTDVQMTLPGLQISASIKRNVAKVSARGPPQKNGLF